MSAKHLNKADARKDDEWFTPTRVVARELEHHFNSLKGKRILCNCNDIFSAFGDYNWHLLSVRDVTVVGKDKYYYSAPYGQTSYEVPYPPDMIPASYCDKVGLQLLSECDVVVTNPPFSKTTSFVKDVLDAGKDLLCINALTNVFNKDVFPYILEGRLRFGYTSPNGVYTHKLGTARSFNNLCWFTTLPVERYYFHSGMTFASREWKRYDIFPDVIHVERCSHIPMDYEGVMGVPATFLQHHNPEQFEIVDARTMTDDKRFLKADMGFMGAHYVTIDGKHPFSRIFIRRTHPLVKLDERS